MRSDHPLPANDASEHTTIAGEQRVAPQSILSGFDFFGGGNIGDDLTMGGFVDAVKTLFPCAIPAVTGLCAWNVASQRIRFPELSWIAKRNATPNPMHLSDGVDCWAGVGDTPFQYTSGDWALKMFQAEAGAISKCQHSCLVNVGAEIEIQPVATQFAPMAGLFDRVSVRDEHSFRVISEMLGLGAHRMFIGADLANIVLSRHFQESKPTSEYVLGMCVGGDELSDRDFSEVVRFATTRRTRVAFLANAITPWNVHEISIYKRLTKYPWSRMTRSTFLIVPPYDNGSLADLINPVRSCGTLISTRYHCALTAAWAGCRVAVIERSSKLKGLADCLGIPSCTLPISRSKLEDLQNRATVVPRSKLCDLREQALEGVRFALLGD